MIDFNLNLSLAYEKVISEQADVISDRLVKKAIREFQKMKNDCLLSMDDYGLKNIWDEICVDTQNGTTCHDIYIKMIEICVSEILIKDLTELEEKILWMQTDDYCEWYDCERDNYADRVNRHIEIPDVFYQGVVKDYISDKILEAASKYSNARIKRFVDRG